MHHMHHASNSQHIRIPRMWPDMGHGPGPGALDFLPSLVAEKGSTG